MCTSFIYRHILRIPQTQIFTTRHMLIYGTRAAVDSALSRMVQNGFITRLARGVFVRDASDEPSFTEIVQAKTKAFRITIKKHVETLLHRFNLSLHPCQITFAKVGHSSSFMTIHGRAYIRGVSEKKLRLLETRVGQIAAALWYLKNGICSYGDVWRATRWFGREERQEFWLHAMLMPAWLVALCREFFCRPRLWAEEYFD